MVLAKIKQYWRHYAGPEVDPENPLLVRYHRRHIAFQLLAPSVTFVITIPFFALLFGAFGGPVLTFPWDVLTFIGLATLPILISAPSAVETMRAMLVRFPQLPSAPMEFFALALFVAHVTTVPSLLYLGSRLHASLQP